MKTITYNYKYPIALKKGWLKYQEQYYCNNESHAVINLITIGLDNICVEPILFNTKDEKVSFTIRFPEPLIKKIEEAKEDLGVSTLSKAIFLLIAKGLAVTERT